MQPRRPSGAIVYTYALPPEGPPVGHRISFVDVPEPFLDILRQKNIPFEVTLPAETTNAARSFVHVLRIAS
jgi:hypothetical protein